MAILPVSAAQPREVAVEVTLDELTAAHVRGLGAEAYADRQAASAALARIGGAARGALEEALQDDDPEVRLRAKAVLGKMPADGRAAIWPEASRQARADYDLCTPAERISLITSMARVGDPPGVIPFLVSLLRGPEAEVQAVLAALPRIPGDAPGRVALDFLRAPQSAAERRARAWALARVGAQPESYRLLAGMKVTFAPAPEADAVVASVRHLLRAGQYEKAVAQARAARKATPDDTRFAYLEAEALAGSGDVDEAAKLCAEALAMHPTEAAVHAAAGRMLSEMGQRRAVAAEWRALLANTPEQSAWGVYARMHLVADLEEGGAFKAAGELLAESLKLLIAMRDAGHAMGILGVEIPDVEAHVAELHALGEKFPLPPEGVADALPSGAVQAELSVVVKDGDVAAYKRALADASVVLRIQRPTPALRLMDVPGVELRYDVAAKQLSLGLGAASCSKPVAWDAGGKTAMVAVLDGDHCHIFGVDGADGAVKKLARYDVDTKVRIVPGKRLAACTDHAARLNGVPVKWTDLLAGKTFDTPPTALRLSVTATTPTGRRFTSPFNLLDKKP
jgi:tetratricopeptide (TPR) repeat protein